MSEVSEEGACIIGDGEGVLTKLGGYPRSGHKASGAQDHPDFQKTL